ncbi:hypothetical protein [Rhizobium tibeticum]
MLKRWIFRNPACGICPIMRMSLGDPAARQVLTLA